jgi:hypothetical protein
VTTLNAIHPVAIINETRRLLDKYGIPGWSVKTTRTTRMLGQCRHSEKLIRISIYQPDGDPMDTILHEIAHALVGPGHGHGHIWMAKARELGANPVKCQLAHLGPGMGYRYACAECFKSLGESAGKLRNLDQRRSRCCKAQIITARG